jgi:hypothetical protein
MPLLICTSQFCLHGSSLARFTLLVSTYPQGIDAEDRDDKLPSNYLKGEAEKNSPTFFEGPPQVL